MNKIYTKQVSSMIYTSSKYLTISRFIAYLEQIKAIMAKGAHLDIAEIGKGNGFVSAILREQGYNVVTIDFDDSLKPDILSSIFDLSENVKQKFDIVGCFEVLEHIRFEEFEKALVNIKSITKPNGTVLISVPYVGYTFRLQLYLSKYGERQLPLVFRLPMFWKEHKFNGQHYWEAGKKGYSIRRIEKLLNKHYSVISKWKHPYNKSQIFFDCKVK